MVCGGRNAAVAVRRLAYSAAVTAATWDTPAAYVMLGALVIAAIGLLVLGVASTPAYRLLGLWADGPWWFSPRGGKTQGLVVAYLGVIVALAALAFVVTDAYAPARIAWTACWSTAAVVFALTVTRVGKRVLRVATGGLFVLADPLPGDYVEADDALDDVDLRAARDAAASGDWRPAAHLLAATLDPDTRHDRVRELAVLAARRGRWLETWLHEEPSNPHALACRVATGVERAWMLRGSDFQAQNVPDFLAVLEDTDADADTALHVSPGDASVLASRLTVARGLQLGVVEHERRLAQLLAVAPHHRGGLSEALQFKAAKWFGSSEEMLRFARAESAAAPAGHATNLLVVVALLEEGWARGDSQRFLQRREVRAEIVAAATRWTEGGPSPVGRAWGHNVLAYAYWFADLPHEALPHLAETHRHLATWPWHDDPREAHAQVRAWARERAGASAVV